MQEALEKLVRSIDPGQLPKTSKKRRRSKSPVCLRSDGNRLADNSTSPSSDSRGASSSAPLLDNSQSDLFLETDDEHLSSLALSPSPPPPSSRRPPLSPRPPPSSPPAARAPLRSSIVPRLSLAVGRSELDDQLEEVEREIEALMTYWECWPGADSSDQHRKTDGSWKRPREDSLGPHGEYIHEDPNYDEFQVEKEALQDYEAELREACIPVAVEQVGCLKEGAPPLVGRRYAKEAVRKRPVSSTPSTARLPCGKLVPLKNLSVCLRRLRLPSPALRDNSGHASDTSSDNERVERLRKPPKGRTRGRLAGASCPAPKRCPSKPYPFRRQSRAVQYSLGGEGAEGGSSEEAWSPAEEACKEREKVSAAGQTRRRREIRQEGLHRHKCPECGRTFGNSSNMWKHLRIHKGEKPFGCHACGKSFSDPSNLTKHQRAHSDLDRRPHRCSLCPKAYFLKGDLEAHFRQHQGIRPFACLDCPSRFYSQANLRSHMEIHIFGKGAHRRPGRTVVCEECGKACNNARHLRKHMRFHRRYECKTCGRFFGYQYDYKVHLATHRGPCGRCGVVGLHLCERQHQGRQLPGLERCPPTSPSSSAPTARSSSPEKVPVLSLPDPTHAAVPNRSSDSALVLRRAAPQPKPSSLTSPLFLGDQTTRPSKPYLTALQAHSPDPHESGLRPLPAPGRAEPLQTNQEAVASPQSPVTVRTRPLPESGSFLLPEKVVGAPAVSASPRQLGPLILMMGALAPQGTGGTNPVHPPAKVSVPNAPILWLVNPSTLQVPPSGKSLGGTQSEFPKRFQLGTEPSTVSPASSRGPVPLVNSNQGPLTLTIPVNGPHSNSTPPGASPAEGAAAQKGLILVNPATLPPGTKITLEIPAQKIVPPLPASRVCLHCRAEYFGNHDCVVRPSGTVRRDEQELIQSRPRDEEKMGAIAQPLPMGSQHPRHVVQLADQEEEGPSSHSFRGDPSDMIRLDGNEGDDTDSPESSPAKSYNFRETRRKVVYVDGGEASEVEQDTDSSWQGEEEESSESDDEEVPPASHRKSLPAVSASVGRSLARRRSGRYMCDICDKQFVYARSLRQHLRLHRAFSCDRCGASFLRREQLSRHQASHAEKGAVA